MTWQLWRTSRPASRAAVDPRSGISSSLEVGFRVKATPGLPDRNRVSRGPQRDERGVYPLLAVVIVSAVSSSSSETGTSLRVRKRVGQGDQPVAPRAFARMKSRSCGDNTI
jgi:hypothetical protein